MEGEQPNHGWRVIYRAAIVVTFASDHLAAPGMWSDA